MTPQIINYESDESDTTIAMDVDSPPFENNTHAKNALPPKPRTPLPWAWRCHRCGRRYNLGVTRRCLYDGHYFCPGQGKHHSRSGFDFEGWATMNEWRREVRELKDKVKKKKNKQERSSWRMQLWVPLVKDYDCLEDCDYPGACDEIRLVYSRSNSEDEDLEPAKKIRKVLG
jgi:hypothetical protein